MWGTGAQPYIVVTPPGQTPISLAELKSWLKITHSAEDSLLTGIIEGVVEQAELYTKRDFITREYETYRDTFGDIGEMPAFYGWPYRRFDYAAASPITIRKSPLQTVESITYIQDGSPVTLDASAYYVVRKSDWSQIASVDEDPWPETDRRQQAITITFKSGYGDDPADVPRSLRNAMLAHAAFVYQNRGDCTPSGGVDCSCARAPGAALSAYNKYRIIEIVA